MATDILQIDYEEAESISKIFDQQSDLVLETLDMLNRTFFELKEGGWEGQGADRFFDEYEGLIEPGMRRLADALSDGNLIVRQIAYILSQAEEEAAGQLSFFADGAGVALASFGLGNLSPFGFIGGLPFNPLGFINGGGAGLSPWATAPMAGLAGFLSPGAVPAGWAGGKNLWLYVGGHSDTIFSVHGRAPGLSGWWRAPRYDNLLTKPWLRFDYGPMGQRIHGISPSGGQIPIAQGQNYFHWNQKGGNSIFGVRNHQLLTHNPNPRPNVLGRIGGSTIVRGASRSLVVLGAGLDIYSVATADNKIEEGVRRGAAWGGAWAGAKGGGALGATIGTFIAPGPGTAIGGAVGGVVGGVGGYFAGYEIGDELYDVGSNIVSGAGNMIDDAGDFVSGSLGKLGDLF